MRKPKTWRAAVATVLAAVTGCAATNPEGVIAMKIDDRTAHVSLASGTVADGDTVALIESRCPSGPRLDRTRKPRSDKCKKVVIGRGVVTRVLNDRYAVAAFPPGVTFDEGDAVQKE